MKRSLEVDSSSIQEADNRERSKLGKKPCEMRKVLVFPEMNFSLDEHDFLVVTDLAMRKINPWKKFTETHVLRFTQIKKNRIDYLQDYYFGIHSSALGELDNLTELNLNQSVLSVLPPSVGKLRNLQCLSIERTRNLRQLPEEMGNLVNLKYMSLNRSSIGSLPSSIGRLQCLEILHLSSTDNLSGLPDEIGDLVGLKELYLKKSRISSLPPSIGQLHNLKILYLSNTEHLSSLPEEIGNLVELEALYVDNPTVVSLSTANGKLPNLKRLYLRAAFPTAWADPARSLVTLAKRCRSLGHVEMNCSISRELFHVLAFNRARCRTNGLLYDTPKLWPIVLNRARKACQGYSGCYGPIFRMQTPDAINRLLLDSREPFLWTILQRNRKPTV